MRSRKPRPLSCGRGFLAVCVVCTARARGRAYILKECAALLVCAGQRGRRERGKWKGHHFAEVGKMIWPWMVGAGAGAAAGLGFDFVEVAALQWV